MRILLIGGGDLAQQIAHYLKMYDRRVDIVGFVDDFAQEGEERFGILCLGAIDKVLALYTYQKMDAVMICIGYSHFWTRQHLFNSIHSEVPFYTFIHPTAFVDTSAMIGDGCCIGPLVVIEQRAVIGPNVFLYGNVNISHDSSVGAHSIIAPSVTIAGFVNVGSRCFLGLHVSIVEQVNVADDVFIGARALVLNSLLEKGTYIGVPAYKK